MSETLEPIDGEEGDRQIFIKNPRKAPPWVVIHEADPEDYEDLGVDPDEQDLHFYYAGAGPKLVMAVTDFYPDFDESELFEANTHVISKSGEQMKAGIKAGEINAEPICASMDVIAKHAAATAYDDALPNGDHVDKLVEGWNEGGHEALERVYFNESASKLSVVAALHRLRGEYQSINE
jgi:hypothetical protein